MTDIIERTLRHLAHIRNQYRKLTKNTHFRDDNMRDVEREYLASCKLAWRQGILNIDVYHTFRDDLYCEMFSSSIADLYRAHNVNPDEPFAA